MFQKQVPLSVVAHQHQEDEVSMKKYTWEQVAEAIEVAGGSAEHVKGILDEAVTYQGRAEQGVDPEGQEKYEPRAPAEKAWADRHRIQVFDPAPETKDGSEKTMSVDQADEPDTETPPKTEVQPSFQRIKQMMS